LGAATWFPGTRADARAGLSAGVRVSGARAELPGASTSACSYATAGCRQPSPEPRVLGACARCARCARSLSHSSRCSLASPGASPSGRTGTGACRCTRRASPGS
jgi:hypothetical protein